MTEWIIHGLSIIVLATIFCWSFNAFIWLYKLFKLSFCHTSKVLSGSFFIASNSSFFDSNFSRSSGLGRYVSKTSRVASSKSTDFHWHTLLRSYVSSNVHDQDYWGFLNCYVSQLKGYKPRSSVTTNGREEDAKEMWNYS